MRRSVQKVVLSIVDELWLRCLQLRVRKLRRLGDDLQIPQRVLGGLLQSRLESGVADSTGFLCAGLCAAGAPAGTAREFG